MIAPEKLARLIERRARLRARLEEKLDGRDIATTAKELHQLEPIADLAENFLNLQRQLDEARQLAADPELAQLARDEQRTLRRELDQVEAELAEHLAPKDEHDARAAVLEIRAGTGGLEAALFAADLLRMYQRYAERHKIDFNLITLEANELGGAREVIAEVRGMGAFGRLKHESGVHRVQRVPKTESAGRIHTSAATVAVLPEASQIDADIKPGELRIDTFRATGAGGQHVNTTDSAVRITHLPSGLVVSCQDEKSQHRNREKALKILATRLYDKQRHEQHTERAENRRQQIGSGDRSERVRTYNFPQSRVTDHRVNLTLRQLDAVLDGALDELIDALIAHCKAETLQRDSQRDSQRTKA